MVVTKTMQQHHQHQQQHQQQHQGGDQAALRKGPWMPEEDEVLLEYVRQYGPRDWSSIRSKGLLPRTGKSCRLRWVNKLKPDLKSGCKFSPEEEKMVVKMQSKLGNKWAKIASYLPGRTDNDVKNFWSTRQKRLLRALQRPKVGGAAAAGYGEGSAGSSSDAVFFGKESGAASELTAFQVTPVPTNFETAFYFGDDEQQQGFEGSKIGSELQSFDTGGDHNMLDQIAAAGEFFPDSNFYLPEQQQQEPDRDLSDDTAAGVTGACYQSFQSFQGSGSSSRSSSAAAAAAAKRLPVKRELEEASAPAVSEEESSRYHAPLRGAGLGLGLGLGAGLGAGVFGGGGGGGGINFLVEQSSIDEASSEFEFFLQQECQQHHQLLVHHDDNVNDFSLHGLVHHHHCHWDKLPGLEDYSGHHPAEFCSNDLSDVKDGTVTMATAATIAASSSSSSSNSKAAAAVLEDSCSPDSVLATTLAGDVFDCLEPLCPASSSEWWMSRTG